MQADACADRHTDACADIESYALADWRTQHVDSDGFADRYSDHRNSYGLADRRTDACPDSDSDALADRCAQHIGSDGLADGYTDHIDSYGLADRNAHTCSVWKAVVDSGPDIIPDRVADTDANGEAVADSRPDAIADSRAYSVCCAVAGPFYSRAISSTDDRCLVFDGLALVSSFGGAVRGTLRRANGESLAPSADEWPDDAADIGDASR